MHPFDPSSPEIIELIMHIFSAKKVPTSYIKEIKNNKSFHKDNWVSVIDTISAKEQLKDFDFYFNDVVNSFGELIFP